MEILDVESSVDCVNDHLTIYNGQDAGSPVLAKLCGSLMVGFLSLSLRFSFLARHNIYVYLEWNRGIMDVVKENGLG